MTIDKIAGGAAERVYIVNIDDIVSEYVPNSRLISVNGLGLSIDGGLSADLSANRTVALASSSNPGAAASILASGSNGELQLSAPTASTSVLTVKTTDDNSANNALEVQDSGGTVLGNIGATGALSLGIKSNAQGSDAYFYGTGTATTATYFRIKGDASNTSLQFYQNDDTVVGSMFVGSSAMLINAVDDRALHLSTNSNTCFVISKNQAITILGIVDSQIPLSIRGAPSQIANLTEWQNSSGTPLTYIEPDGEFVIDQDSKALKLGADQDFTILYDGSNTILESVGGIIVNDSGADSDFTIKGDTDTDLFNLDAGTDTVRMGMRVTNPSATTNITAAGGITVTEELMRIQGSGGAVNITAVPQIAAGVDGQCVTLVGMSDTNTVTLDPGDGVHLHGGNFILGEKDFIQLKYNSSDSEWQEICRNAPTTEKAWSFDSPSGAGATFYVCGYYDFAASDNDFNPSVNFGSANVSYAAHFFVVAAAGGAGGVDTVVRITGTSIDDNATRTTTDTEDLTLDDAGAAGAYYETTKKWIGQVSINKISGPDLLCNYGWCKYYDNRNTDFRVVGLEVTWLAGGTDSDYDVILRHHKTTGWTYNAGATPTPPTALAQLTTDHSTESNLANGEQGAWKRVNLNTTINGSGSEGTIWEIQTGVARAIETGNIIMSVRAD